MLSRNVILTPEALQEKIDYLMDQSMVVIDIETMPPEGAPDAYRAEPVVNQCKWIGFSTHGEAFSVPMGHPNGNKVLQPARRKKNPVTKKFDMFPAKWDEPPEQMTPGQVFSMIEPVLFNEGITKAGSGLLFDILSLAKYYGGRPMVGPFHDTTVIDWLLNENRLGQHGLKDLAYRDYKRKYDTENVGRKIETHSFNTVAHYLYMDVKFNWLVLHERLRMLEEDNLQQVYALEREVFEVLISVGLEGTPVDEEAMEALQPVLQERRSRSAAETFRLAGKRINLNSPKQKVDLFYGEKSEGNLGLKPWRLTKGGIKKQKEGIPLTKYDYSTDKESLEKYSSNKVVSAFLEFQEVDRVLGTYVEGYLGDPEDFQKHPRIIFDGKVYPDFVQYGTVTGRFSCRAPNLQNIPRPTTDLGKSIRSLFIAGEGHKLVVADYGQVELVVLAHFVGRGALYDGFFDGIDPHTMTAAMVFGQDPKDLAQRIEEGDPQAKEWRQISKNLNFAIVYGAGPDKVASMSKVSVAKAKGFLRTHERQFPEIYEFKDRALEICRSRKPPHLVTLAGRKRRIPSIMSRDGSTRWRAERQAINSLIQGTAADLIKTAMVRLHKGLEEEHTGKMILTVHDELVSRCPEENADKCAEIVKEAMVGSGIQSMVDVPLSIDLKIVDKWSEAK